MTSTERWQLLPELTAEEYAALKVDVAAHGIRVPVVVDADTGAVIDGHHRLRAWEELRAEGARVPDYPRDVRRFSDDDERAGFVLAANLFRRHLDREQRGEVVAMLRAEGWSVRRIAETTGLPRSTVADDISGVRSRTPDGAAAEPAEVTGADGKTYKAARPKPAPSLFVRGRRDEGRARAALAGLPAGANAPSSLLRAEEVARQAALVVRREAAGAAARAAGLGWELRSGDFRQALADVPDASLDAVVTDPPYNDDGVPLYEDLARWAAAKLKPGRLAAVYCGLLHLDEEMALLAEGGLIYLWHGVNLLPGRHTKVHVRMVNGSHRSVLLFSAGPYQPRRWLHDTVWSPGGAGGPTSRPLHPWQQALDPVRHWVRQVSGPGELIADPFLGSGTTAVACVIEERRFIGADIDAANVGLARQRLEEAEAEAEAEQAEQAEQA